jgi:hypothetical protein
MPKLLYDNRGLAVAYLKYAKCRYSGDDHEAHLANGEPVAEAQGSGTVAKPSLA